MINGGNSNSASAAASFYQTLQMSNPDSASPVPNVSSSLAAVQAAYLLPGVLAAGSVNGEKRPLVNYSDILAGLTGASNGGAPDAKIARNRRSFHFKERADEREPSPTESPSPVQGRLDYRNMIVTSAASTGIPYHIKEEQLSPPQFNSNGKQSGNSSTPEPRSPTPNLSIGVPVPAQLTRLNAPVHIDVGGTAYTTTLQTLSKFPNSRLAKLFNGNIPIVLDSLKQHYFIDRDGKAFRHILNYLRNGSVAINQSSDIISQVLEEAIFYEIEPLVNILKSKLQDLSDKTPGRETKCNEKHVLVVDVKFAVNSMEEKLFISGNLMDIQKYASNKDLEIIEDTKKHVTSMKAETLGFTNSVQLLNRLYQHNFEVISTNASTDSDVKFTQYVLVKNL